MGQSGLPPLRALNFGDVDARREAREDPQLLLEGYYDYRQAAYGIETKHIWLLLGPKGSGKTAVLEHLRLKWGQDANRHFSVWDLSSFPVNDVASIMSNRTPGASRTQNAWEFVLLLRLLSSLGADLSVWSRRGDISQVLQRMREYGFIREDWDQAILHWSNKPIQISAADLGIDQVLGTDSRESLTPIEMVGLMKRMLEEARVDGQHKVAIDGLDSFFFETSDQLNSMAGLVRALSELNGWLKDRDLPFSFVAAVRSDMFDVLPAPDLNKLKQRSVYLDWNLGGIGRENGLWELLTRKAAVSHQSVTNVVTQYLGKSTQVWVYPDIPTLVLDHTRLLPRDVVAMMKAMQMAYGGKSQVPEDSAKRAVIEYCQQYFAGEIFDNLAGLLPQEKARGLAQFREALRTAPTRVFDLKYVSQELEGELTPSEVRMLLKQMFDVGGLGIRNGRHTDFVYRNAAGAGFSPRHSYLLHDALTRAWNRPWI